MLILALILIVLGILLNVGGALWLLVEAFQESIVWGVCVLLVPFANLVFICKHWIRGKGPFVAHLVGVVLLLGSTSVISGYQRKGGKLPDFSHLSFLKQAPPQRSEVADSGMFKAKKDAEWQIRLVNLQTRETELRDRKAALVPGDRAGAAALAEEIKRYNADLQPVLEQMKKAEAAKQ